MCNEDADDTDDGDNEAAVDDDDAAAATAAAVALKLTVDMSINKDDWWNVVTGDNSDDEDEELNEKQLLLLLLLLLVCSNVTGWFDVANDVDIVSWQLGLAKSWFECWLLPSIGDNNAVPEDVDANDVELFGGTKRGTKIAGNSGASMRW